MGRFAKGAVIALTAALALASSDARAELFSKAYAFKPNTTLEIGTELPGGLRLDTVEFVVPEPSNEPQSVFGGPKVKVGISNLGTGAVKIGVALAVTDADGKLVGVASGGTKLFPMRADRAIVYTLSFTGAYSQLASGTVFRISVEPLP